MSCQSSNRRYISLSRKVIKWLKNRYVFQREATGVIQEGLMELGKTLEQADDYIEKWNQELPEEWFSDQYDPLCHIRVSTEYDVTKLLRRLKDVYDIDLVHVIQYGTGTYDVLLLYNTSKQSIKGESNEDK